MKISITGSGDISKIIRHTNLSKEEIGRIVIEVGEIIAKKGHEIVVIPSKGISAEIAKAYKEAGGKKVYGVIPINDKKFGIKHIEKYFSLVDERIEVNDWYEAASEIVPSGDVCVVIGMSSGVIRGVGVLGFYRKFFNNKTKVLWLRNTISQELPKEIGEEIPIEYLNSVKELKNKL